MTIVNGASVRVVNQSHPTSVIGELVLFDLTPARNGQYGTWDIRLSDDSVQSATGRLYLMA